MAKTCTFSGHTLTVLKRREITSQTVLQLLAAALLLNTGQISKLCVPISQLDTKTWGIRSINTNNICLESPICPGHWNHTGRNWPGDAVRHAPRCSINTTHWCTVIITETMQMWLRFIFLRPRFSARSFRGVFHFKISVLILLPVCMCLGVSIAHCWCTECIIIFQYSAVLSHTVYVSLVWPLWKWIQTLISFHQAAGQKELQHNFTYQHPDESGDLVCVCLCVWVCAYTVPQIELKYKCGIWSRPEMYSEA